MKLKINKQDLKEKISVIGILCSGYIAIRLIFFTYVTEEWYYTVGVISVTGLLIYYLARYNKLGWFGRLFMKQLLSLTTRPNANIYYCYFFITIIASGITIFWVDEGNESLFHDRQLFLAIEILYTPSVIEQLEFAHVQMPDDSTIYEAVSMSEYQRQMYELKHVQDGNFIMALLLSLENSEWNGWLLNFATVTLAGEIEGLGIFFFYRYKIKHDLVSLK